MNNHQYIDKTEQGHGHAFETMIKAGFPNSSNKSRSIISKFDIEKNFDKVLNLPTSVKTTKNKTIGLADARNAFKINEDFRMLIVQYEQKNELKVPKKLYEYIISKENWEKIKGKMPLNEIEDFHNHLTSFAKGEHVSGRKFAQEKKKELNEKYDCAIILNPKLDSKSQRRLQASISIDVLSNYVTPQIYEANQNIIFYRGASIAPIMSQARNLKRNPA